jgi:hypothetical protein
MVGFGTYYTWIRGHYCTCSEGFELTAESGVIFVTSPVLPFMSLGPFDLLEVFLNNVLIGEDGV